MRIRAILNRKSEIKKDEDTLIIGKGIFDAKRLTFTVDNSSVPCLKYEVLILKLLASQPGHIFSRDEIIHAVWKNETFPSQRTIDNHIVRLRKKIALCEIQNSVNTLESIYGNGYRLNLPTDLNGRNK
jgi:DNA-binding response OmpR family regulator